MSSPEAPVRRDLVVDWRTYLLAWGIPSAAVIAGGFIGPPARTMVWITALLWMGSACLLNARRCGRTHCRITGPYYFILIGPVLLQGAGLVSFGSYAWWLLGGAILLGGKAVWWASERVWGPYSPRLDRTRLLDPREKPG